MELTLEWKEQPDRTPVIGPIMMTPPVGEKGYWHYRVRLTDKQSIVGFPKFGTIGIGFEVEDEDWNTNLPYTQPAEKIFSHIKKNRGDDSISDEDCIRAIEMIQAAVREDRDG